MARVLKALLALSTLVGSFMLLTSGPASADPYWEPVSKTSKFHCSGQRLHPTHDVTVQTCVVVNSTATQAVAIVANFGGSAVSIEAPNVALYVNGPISYDRNCLASTLSAGETRACFGPTQQRPCSATVTAWAQYIIQGWVTDLWSPSRQMCT
ncbi:hypothetical protein [Actinokineospora fastidiosa]|uniref:Uncharacterized protein n=1 Tax=Actinokineospora fastidiosa TaxID=1816 RepID=A0A918G6I6_9PSEU|nr:hypothetical protein [Actinokineospora fastidiosa]GGS21160.1 hypothetical protein GCM10010171_12320 [Actinokineospora fastidiosa]